MEFDGRDVLGFQVMSSREAGAAMETLSRRLRFILVILQVVCNVEVG